MSVLRLWVLSMATLMLLACVDGAAPDYRYRLTVEVETPEGLKTGSSVIQVEQSLARAVGEPASSQIYTRVHGEAVAVDLPDGHTLFALPRSDSDIQWAGTIVSALTPRIAGIDGEPRFEGVLSLKGEVEVPRQCPRNQQLSAYLMLVRFWRRRSP